MSAKPDCMDVFLQFSQYQIYLLPLLTDLVRLLLCNHYIDKHPLYTL